MATKKSKAVVLSDREAPIERVQSAKDYLASVFNDAQMNLLLNRTPEYAKKKRPGPGGKALTYVSHGYVTDQLNKIFGFNWDLVLDQMANGKMYELQVEITGKNNRGQDITTRHLAVCGHIEARIVKNNKSTTIIKYGFGSQIWHPTMEFGDALKAARSDLLKTCAMQIGVALDLYWNDMAEVEKFEQLQDEKRKQDELEQQEIIEASLSDVETSKNNGYPVNGVSMISKALALKMTKEEIEEAVGMTTDEIINSYKPEYWNILLKVNNENSKTSSK